MGATVELFDRPELGSRAVLVQLALRDRDEGDSVSEFRELAVSAGAEIVGFVTGQRRSPHPHYFVGRGKAEELAALVRLENADIVIFDHRLSPAQERNLESELKCRVLDRIGLILDIFAQRASTFEGKLQVELAQLTHLSTRLVRGWTHLERQKGGIGLRGPGETQLETDRRLIGTRIKQIHRRLDKVQRRRAVSRKSREKRSVAVASLVGYTNAGKSTLFNRMTGAHVIAEDRLFATLDPTLRRLSGSEEPGVVLADTVGFIANLPHEVVAAFRATLEETERASVLLHIVDASAPGRYDRIAEVNDVLDSIGAERAAQLEVFNKIDVNGELPRIERDAEGLPIRVWLSAETGDGCALLVEAIEERLARRRECHRILFSPSDGRLRANLYSGGHVTEESFTADASEYIEGTVPGALQGGAVMLTVEISAQGLERALRDAAHPDAVIAAEVCESDDVEEAGDEVALDCDEGHPHVPH